MVRLVGSRSKKQFNLGDKVRVKILSADIILRRIDLGIAEHKRNRWHSGFVCFYGFYCDFALY